MKKIRNVLSKSSVARGLYRAFNFPYSIQLNGQKIKAIKLYDSRLIVSERWMGELVNLLLPMRPGAFIDVGANLGQTLCQVMTIDPKRSYVGFEPNPACNLYLQELVRRNSFKDTKIVPVGLHTRTQIMELQLYNDNISDAGASVIDGYWSYSGKSPAREGLNNEAFRQQSA